MTRVGFFLERRLEILEGRLRPSEVGRKSEENKVRAGTLESDISTDTFETARSAFSSSQEGCDVPGEIMSRDGGDKIDLLSDMVTVAMVTADHKSQKSDVESHESNIDTSTTVPDPESLNTEPSGVNKNPSSPLIPSSSSALKVRESEPTTNTGRRKRRSRLSALASICPCCTVS